MMSLKHYQVTLMSFFHSQLEAQNEKWNFKVLSLTLRVDSLRTTGTWGSTAACLSTTRCSLASCPSSRNSAGRTEGLHEDEYALTEWEKDELLCKWKKCGRKPLASPSNDFREVDN
eukprot:1448339-Ditylum_brightwellii.AAC.1